MTIEIKQIILENDIRTSPLRAGMVAGGLATIATIPGSLYGDHLSSGSDNTYTYLPLAAGGLIGSIAAINQNRLNLKKINRIQK